MFLSLTNVKISNKDFNWEKHVKVHTLDENINTSITYPLFVHYNNQQC